MHAGTARGAFHTRMLRHSAMSNSATPWAGASGSSVRGISQSGILEWVAISYSRGSSRPRDRTLGLLLPQPPIFLSILVTARDPELHWCSPRPCCV